MEYVAQGATNVVGIDISEKMLATAATENTLPKINYNHLVTLNGGFYLVISSLAIHYVKDFTALANKSTDCCKTKIISDPVTCLF